MRPAPPAAVPAQVRVQPPPAARLRRGQRGRLAWWYVARRRKLPFVHVWVAGSARQPPSCCVLLVRRAGTTPSSSCPIQGEDSRVGERRSIQIRLALRLPSGAVPSGAR